MTYLQHGRRHSRLGTDPVDTGVDWISATATADIANTSGAVTDVGFTPNWVNVPIESGDIDHQTDDGSLYAAYTTGTHAIQIKQAGSYLVRCHASWGEGHANHGMSAAVITGPDASRVWDYNVVRFVPLSYTGGIGGGLTMWEQLLVIDNTTTDTAVYAQGWQNSGGTITGVLMTIQILRLT